jgi:very-short-patch-repair endonuclease
MQYLGDDRRRAATPAEAEFERILNSLNGGVLRGRFLREWVCGTKWIVDYFFPEIRLAVEIDGGYHKPLSQAFRDARRELEIERFMVTIVRFTNAEVFGDREALIVKLRTAWRKAQRSFRRDSHAPNRKAIKKPAAARPKPPAHRSTRKKRWSPHTGGWTTLEQGVFRVGDNIKKVYVDDGFGGSRDAVRAMKRAELSEMRRRAKGE